MTSKRYVPVNGELIRVVAIGPEDAFHGDTYLVGEVGICDSVGYDGMLRMRFSRLEKDETLYFRNIYVQPEPCRVSDLFNLRGSWL